MLFISNEISRLFFAINKSVGGLYQGTGSFTLETSVFWAFQDILYAKFFFHAKFEIFVYLEKTQKIKFLRLT